MASSTQATKWLGLAWHCTPQSIKKGEVTWLAVLETLVAVIIYWFIAWYWHTHTHLLVSACIAPLLLLRSRQSVELGKKWLHDYWFINPTKYHWRTWRRQSADCKYSAHCWLDEPCVDIAAHA